MSLKTDYKDAMFQGSRKYQMIQNDDGTISFEDVTEYTQTGDSFGAKDINETNTEVEKKFDSTDVVDPMVTTQAGFAADAKATGDALKSQNSKLESLNFRHAQVIADMSTALINTDFAVPYPEGFDRGNCFVIGVSGFNKNYGVWYGYINVDVINIILGANIIMPLLLCQPNSKH